MDQRSTENKAYDKMTLRHAEDHTQIGLPCWLLSRERPVYDSA